MRYVSVCDGIGAVHAAWQPLGLECAWTSEIDDFPAAVVEQRWGFANRGDMTKYEEWPDEAVDILVGGTPCQSFSVAGLRKGLRDPRGGLMLTFLEIARRYRPRWVVWENVPGVLSSNGGRDFGSFLGALGELGYGWAYRVLDAQWFGVAQRRRRVFVVGCLGDQRRAAAVLFERESVRRDSSPRRGSGEGVAGSTAPCAGGSGKGGVVARIVAQDVAGTLACNTGPNGNDAGNFCSNQGVDAGYIVAVNIEHAPGNHGSSNAASVRLRDVAEPLTRSEHKGHTVVCSVVCFADHRSSWRRGGLTVTGNIADTIHRAKGRSEQQVVAYESGPGYWMLGEEASALRAEGENRPSRPSHVIAFSSKDYGGDALINTSPTPRSMNNVESSVSGGGQVAVCIPIQEVGKRTGPSSTGDVRAGIGLGENDDPMFTLQAGAQHGVASTLGAASTLQEKCVRRLMPIECERLQGVPDDYTAITFRGKPAADGPRYKSLGNSMAVPVMRWIGARIIANSDQ